MKAGPGPLRTTRSSSITVCSTLTWENTETYQRALGKDQLEIVFCFLEDKYLEKALFLIILSVEKQSVSAVKLRNVSLTLGMRLDC